MNFESLILISLRDFYMKYDRTFSGISNFTEKLEVEGESRKDVFHDGCEYRTHEKQHPLQLSLRFYRNNPVGVRRVHGGGKS